MELKKGVVEDNKSPLKDGKVRVRILGVHTENNEFSDEKFNTVKSSELPWLECMGSLENGLNSGIGLSKIPTQGTIVWLYYFEEYPNDSIVIGTVTGNPTETSKYKSGIGFSDPDEEFPLKERLNEPDINRLARAQKLSSSDSDSDYKTIHQKIIDNKSKTEEKDDISEADVTQEEPDSLNDKSIYPNVQVLETKSGHVIEIDDTPDNERIRTYHKSGSYIEIKPDGSIVTKSTGEENHYIYTGDVNSYIEKNVRSYIEGNLDELISGYVKRNIKNNLQEHINGGVKENIDMDFFSKVKGYFKIQADGNLEIINDVKITGGLLVTKDITSSGGITSSKDIRSGADIEDSEGRLSILRTTYDSHVHIGNLGIPTAPPTTTDPKSPANYPDFTWSNSPLGFK